MSMIPLFPSLRPSVSSSICFDVDQPCDDESELREMEKEYDAWVDANHWYIHIHSAVTFYFSVYLPPNKQLNAVKKIANDLPPFGENPPVGAPEPDTDDEGDLFSAEIRSFTHNYCIFIF